MFLYKCHSQMFQTFFVSFFPFPRSVPCVADGRIMQCIFSSILICCFSLMSVVLYVFHHFQLDIHCKQLSARLRNYILKCFQRCHKNNTFVSFTREILSHDIECSHDISLSQSDNCYRLYPRIRNSLSRMSVITLKKASLDILASTSLALYRD